MKTSRLGFSALFGLIVILSAATPTHAAHAWTMVGQLENLDCSTISGWAYDPDATGSPSNIEVVITDGSGNQQFDHVYSTNVLRSGVNSQYGLSGNHGFSISTPSFVIDGKTHVVYVVALKNSGNHQYDHDLTNGGQHLVCTPPTPPAPAPAPTVNNTNQNANDNTNQNANNNANDNNNTNNVNNQNDINNQNYIHNTNNNDVNSNSESYSKSYSDSNSNSTSHSSSNSTNNNNSSVTFNPTISQNVTGPNLYVSPNFTPTTVVYPFQQNSPECSIQVSPSTVVPGQRAYLTWTSFNSFSGTITSFGAVTPSGSVEIAPVQNTTFTGIFVGNNGQQVSCQAIVQVAGTLPLPPIQVPPQVPYVTLSQVPYTGLDLGTWGTFVYWTSLALWCLFMAYLIVVKRVHYKIADMFSWALFSTGNGDGEETEGTETPATPVEPVADPEETDSDAFVRAQIFGTN